VLTFSINSNGTIGANIGSALSLNLAGGKPAQIAIDNTGGWVFVGDATTGQISVFSVLSNGTLAFNFSTTTIGTQAAGLAFALTPSGGTFLYAANPDTGSVSIYSFAGGVLTAGLPLTGFGTPTGLAVDNPSDAANLFVTDAGNGTITELSINSTTGALTTSGSSPTENPANSASAPMFVATNG
jgi:6-phosphogluconolactonase (cycloisomerase 2 family)